MPIYLVKCSPRHFNPEEQPEDFVMKLGIENKFFYCECSVPPNGDMVVEVPPEIYDLMYLFEFKNGKRVAYDLWNGRVAFSEDSDSKHRREIQYTPQQLVDRCELFKWLALNVYLPDKVRLMNLSAEEVEKCKNDIQDLSNDLDVKQFTIDNLYYDL